MRQRKVLLKRRLQIKKTGTIAETTNFKNLLIFKCNSSQQILNEQIWHIGIAQPMHIKPLKKLKLYQQTWMCIMH